MKRILQLLFLLSMTLNYAGAQTVKIYFKDGNTNVFEIAKIDSIVCSNDTIENVAQEEIVPDSYFSEQYLLEFISSLYLDLVKFETGQLFLEAQRTGNIDQEEIYNYENISPYSSAIRETWTAGYKAINKCNNLLAMLPEMNLSYDYKKYTKEVRIIRAYIYYNMTQLWGNLPFIVDYSSGLDYAISSTSQSVILDYLCNELEDIIENTSSGDFSNDLFRFNKESARMILAECEMLRGNTSVANDVLEKLTQYSPIFELNLNYVSEENIFWGYRYYMQDSNNIYIYTTTMSDLFKMENFGYLDGLADSWNENCQVYHSLYGYWAALKRIGKAEEVTGCEPYMLLMPIPQQELMFNSCLVQNPGW